MRSLPLQPLKQIAPRVSRAAVMFNPQTAPYAEYYLQPLKVVAPKLGVTTFAAAVHSESDIEEAINKLGAKPGGGLILMPDGYVFAHRKSIIALAARSRVPVIYYLGSMAADGGLISYGVDNVDLFRRAAPYVDRILRGAKPVELPVQQPSKYELFINLKTAKALGLVIPQELLLRADKIIE